jgi:hypothetical protein
LDAVLPKSFHRFSRLTVSAGIVACERPTLFDLEGSDRVVPYVAHIGGVPIEAFDLSRPCLLYTTTVYTVNGTL